VFVAVTTLVVTVSGCSARASERSSVSGDAGRVAVATAGARATPPPPSGESSEVAAGARSVTGGDRSSAGGAGGSFHFGFEKYAGPDADIWYDDIAVSTQPIGCQ